MAENVTEKLLKTRIQLRYDSLENWASKNPELKKGEVAIAYLPPKGNGDAPAASASAVLMKVGPGQFNALPWMSALAADVFGWAKETGLTVHKDGTGNVVSSVEWDATLNNGKGGIKYTTAAVATAEGLDDLQKTVAAIEKEIDDKEADWAHNTTYTFTQSDDKKTLTITDTDGGSKAITFDYLNRSEIDAILAGYYTKGEVDTIVAGYYTKGEADAKFVEEEGFDARVKAIKVDNAGHADTAGNANHAETAGSADQAGVATKTVAPLTVKIGGGTKSHFGDTETIVDVDAAITTHDNAAKALFETKSDASGKLVEAKKYTDDAIAAIPAQTDYSVTMTEDTSDTSVAKTYVFSQCGAQIGSIKLAKELVVTSGTVETVTEAGKPYTEAKVGDKYIKLVIANQTEPVYVPAKDLVDIYTAGKNATEVQVAISNTNEITATLVNKGVATEKINDKAVTNDKIADYTIGNEKLDKEAIAAGYSMGQIVANGTSRVGVSEGGRTNIAIELRQKSLYHGGGEPSDEGALYLHLEGDTVPYASTAFDIDDNKITTAKIVDKAVTKAKLADDVQASLDKADVAEQNAKDYADSLVENYGDIVTHNAAEFATNAENGAKALADENKLAIDAINNAETGILAQAKKDAGDKAAVVLGEAQSYADDKVAALAGEGNTTTVAALAGRVSGLENAGHLTEVVAKDYDEEGKEKVSGLKVQNKNEIAIDDSIVFVLDCNW